ncbi:unnamed protein product, partial [Urochloa humidicola]
TRAPPPPGCSAAHAPSARLLRCARQYFSRGGAGVPSLLSISSPSSWAQAPAFSRSNMQLQELLALVNKGGAVGAGARRRAAPGARSRASAGIDDVQLQGFDGVESLPPICSFLPICRTDTDGAEGS